MQQKLFIAGKELSLELANIEQQIRVEQAQGENGFDDSVQWASAQPRSARWAEEVQLAVDELRKLVPPGSSLVLVNEDQWGNERTALKDRRAIPFLEREGQYWGPPADDETAIGELERLRQAGAGYIAFAWHCFWWLGHYQGFHQHLRQRYACLWATDRLVVFSLK
jgi:hypothetical protein